ncbi:uncharacterized protein LOC126264328 [Aethina tumida]|uniref:uncharacterized protein LOC126264328 n=1 Tax=Aethina tumida TaxID=116153 RepID=UPI0021492403|nr:uncharacterized protein LOC126264328 [Aethina tumida]
MSLSGSASSDYSSDESSEDIGFYMSGTSGSEENYIVTQSTPSPRVHQDEPLETRNRSIPTAENVISSSLIDLPDIPEVDLSESTTDEDVSVAPVTLSKNGTMNGNDKVKDIKKGKTDAAGAVKSRKRRLSTDSESD